jgi:hypothetical protein
MPNEEEHSEGFEGTESDSTTDPNSKNRKSPPENYSTPRGKKTAKVTEDVGLMFEAGLVYKFPCASLSNLLIYYS